MDTVRRHRDTVAYLAALVLPLGIALLLIPFRSNFDEAASALVLVAAVVAVAAFGNRTAGFLATVSATLWFDLFLTEPYYHLTITHRGDIETAISLFVVGIVVTELVARSRHHHEVASERSDHVGLVHDLSELTSSGASTDEVVVRAGSALVELLDLRGCRFEADTESLPSARLEHDGDVVVGGLVWDVPNLGMPSSELELLVHHRGLTAGRFMLRPTPGVPVDRQRRLVAVVVADQVGAALQPHLRPA